jgi:hypothetical protein
MWTKIEEDSAMATYSIDDLSRREILKMSAILGKADGSKCRTNY